MVGVLSLWILTAFLGDRLAPALSSSDPVSLRVLYQTSAGCPGLESFLQQVMTRTRRARVAVGDEDARILHIVVGPAASGFVGTLKTTAKMSDAPGAFADLREVRGATCAEVITALAFTTALSLDPNADADPAPPVTVAVSTAEPANPAARMPSPWLAGFGLDGVGGILPHNLWGPSVVVERADPSADLTVAYRLRVRYASDLGAPRDRYLKMTLVTVGADLCLPKRLSVAWTMTPCLSGEGGLLRGEGLNLAQVRAVTFGWYDVGGAFRVGWVNRAADRHSGWLGLPGVEGEIGFLVPLTRPAFVRQMPQEVIARTGPVGGWISVRMLLPFFSRSKLP